MIFETQRLLAREWTENDFDAAQRLWGDPKVMGLISSSGPLTRDLVLKKMKEQIDLQKRYGVQYWATIDKNNGEIVGCCGLRPYDIPNNVFEIGFHIMSEHWGRGFATEAARGAIKYAREVRKIRKLFAGHNPNNSASCKVLEKLGFQFVCDKFYEPTGLMHPSYDLELRD
jgi:[ribosomal protein S5]-alanine N-acetyltransferase